jgi:hypothetical protein
MTDDKDDLINQLAQRLREAIDEIDRLKAELARKTEGASAHTTLSDIHRNPDLPAAVRAKAATACLPYEVAPLQSVPPPLDLVAEPLIPLAELVSAQRARADRMEREARQIKVLPDGRVLVLDESGGHGPGNGSGD